MEPTGVDLPGEASTIMHQKENVGLVELATMSFGQSFQVTPIQMAATVSSLINGGKRVTPHLGVRVCDFKGEEVKKFDYENGERIVSEETSKIMQRLLESVVSEGSGKNAYVEGYAVGGKTATSQTLPRSANKYISSFIGFAPADDPQVLGMCVIDNPKGIYYGGTIAAPVIGNIFENIFPYLGIEKNRKCSILGKVRGGRSPYVRGKNNKRNEEVDYGLYSIYSGIDIICTECDYGTVDYTGTQKTKDGTDRAGRWREVPPEKGGNTDHGRRDHLIEYCHYFCVLSEGLSKDHSDSVCDAGLWSDRIFG